MMCQNKNRLLMQFHITGRCNLRCKHCYRTEGDVQPLSYDNVISIIDQYRDLRREYNSRHGIKKRGHINITGGEPFFRGDIKDILRYMGEHRDEFSYGVLSNGSFINEDMMNVLRETGCSFVQLSIDGNRDMHDSLRAEGDYDRVLSKAEELEKNGIMTYISFTANAKNYSLIPHVARECRKRGVTKLWSDRLVPIGYGEELEELTVTEHILPSYLESLAAASGASLSRLLHPKTIVTMNRALQFQGGKGEIYSCSAGDCLITVDEFGDIMPCRRMPIKCGNALTDSLTEIYFENETFRALRQEAIPKECSGCKYASLCKGGARCQSYAAYGTFYRADPACPIKKPI